MQLVMARPKKYSTQKQRKAARRASAKATSAPSLKARYFRLVVPNLQQFKDQPKALLELKENTFQLLSEKQNSAGLQYYKIAIQTHSTTGVPHLDILLCYSKTVQKSLHRFDYLIKPGHLSRYKKLNQAIISYGDKQDLAPLTNMPKDCSLVLKKQQLQQNPYELLRSAMLQDPFSFNSISWLKDQGLISLMSKMSWSKHLALLGLDQQDQCNRLLQAKPGFQPITRQLIQSRLTASQLQTYDSWSGYAKIVQKLNEIVQHGGHRPFKTKQLFLAGCPDIGKSTLALEIQNYISVYYKDVSNWFPSYRSNVYKMILWDQFNLRSMSYPDLLKFLQGLKMDLQYKGGSVLKTDNQLIFMTSNMTLEQHICRRFKSQDSRAHARANLGARIEQVIVPAGVTLFLLMKLFSS